MKQLKIYFTSDLHGYVYPTDYTDTTEKPMGLLNILSHYQKDGNTLIIDAGDTIQGSPFSYYLSGQKFNTHPILRCSMCNSSSVAGGGMRACSQSHRRCRQKARICVEC